MSNGEHVVSRTGVKVVFVCGSSRSGTTMMSRILGRSPAVHTMEELHFFEGMWDPADEAELPPSTIVSYLTRLVAIERTGFRKPARADECLDEATTIASHVAAPTGPDVYAAFAAHRAAENGAEIVCDQTPRNVYMLEELLDWFPTSHAIVLIRDPRDVMLSQKHRWRRDQRGIGDMSRFDQIRLWAGYHPYTTMQLWRSATSCALRLSEHPRVEIVRFEDLVTTPQESVKLLCDAVGLAYDPGLLEIPRSGSSHGVSDGTVSGLDTRAVARWREGGLSRTELAMADRIAGDHLAQLAYEPSGAVPWRIGSALWAVALPFKAALVLLLSFRRAARIARLLRRRLDRRTAR